MAQCALYKKVPKSKFIECYVCHAVTTDFPHSTQCCAISPKSVRFWYAYNTQIIQCWRPPIILVVILHENSKSLGNKKPKLQEQFCTQSKVSATPLKKVRFNCHLLPTKKRSQQSQPETQHKMKCWKPLLVFFALNIRLLELWKKRCTFHPVSSARSNGDRCCCRPTTTSGRAFKKVSWQQQSKHSKSAKMH